MRALCIAILCLSVLIYAGETFAESDEICCTWVNSKYVSGNPPQKLIFSFDGTFATYNTKASTDALQRGTFQIIKKWKDSEGNILYQIKMQNPVSGTKYKLARVSKDGDKLKFLCKFDKFPDKIDENAPDYCNYMRYSMY